MPENTKGVEEPVGGVVEITTKLPNGTVNTFNMNIDNYLVSQELSISYICLNDGGPVMRPTHAPNH